MCTCQGIFTLLSFVNESSLNCECISSPIPALQTDRQNNCEGSIVYKNVVNTSPKRPLGTKGFHLNRWYDASQDDIELIRDTKMEAVFLTQSATSRPLALYCRQDGTCTGSGTTAAPPTTARAFIHVPTDAYQTVRSHLFSFSSSPVNTSISLPQRQSTG